MNSDKRRSDQDLVAGRFHHGRRILGRQDLIPLSAVVLACAAIAALGSETPDGPKPAPSSPGPEAFPELAAAQQPIDRFVFENAILVGEAEPASSDASQRSCDPFPPGSRILAYEENDHFVCASGDASHVIGSPQPEQGEPVLVRRFLFLKPSLFVLDDFVSRTGSSGSLRWRLGCRSEPAVAGRSLRLADNDQELVCETLWPVSQTRQTTLEGPTASESVYQIEVLPEAGAKGVRWLHVLDLRRAGDQGAAAKSVVEDRDGRFELTISTSDRTFRLSLPRPGVAAGRIAVDAADGRTIVPRRPLPSGVLPHGPEGVRLIERWDRAYRDGRKPGWDSGAPAKDLKQAVEEGVVRPCRTAVLGCGSGTNGVYLAEKGFDVTAIDVAPTALSIAEAKASKAGVRVEWMLADVLALPELEPFDFVFDRGCYHNVRYVDGPGFVESVRRLSRPGAQILILSLNRDGPPGVGEQLMRDDFSSGFEVQWLRESVIESGREGGARRPSWSLMLERKASTGGGS